MAPAGDDIEDDDFEKERGTRGPGSRYNEFDCPSCNANNPVETPFGDGDEVLCNYCGTEFKVRVGDDGRAKFKEL